MLRLATVVVIASPGVIARAKAIEAFGFRGLDALHIASTEAGNADALRFTMQTEAGAGNYVRERHRALGSMSVEQFVRRMGTSGRRARTRKRKSR